MNFGTGGNTTKPTNRFLINTLSAKQFGVFVDAADGTSHLKFKQLGIELISQGHGGANAGSNVEIDTAVTQVGKVKAAVFTFDTDCPCKECGFDYGIYVVIRSHVPGYFNDFLQQQQKPYGGSISNIGNACVSGTLSSTIIQTMNDDIISQINADLGYSWNDGPNVGSSGANVSAGRAFKLTGFVAGMGVHINGTVYAGQATIAALVASVNAGTDAYAYADPTTPLTEMWLIMNSAPTTSVISSGMVVANKGIGLVSNSVNWTFEIESNQFDYDSTGTTATIQANVWPLMTSWDLFRLFPTVSKHGSVVSNGKLATQTWITQPIEGAKYKKYTFKVMDTKNSLDMPNGIVAGMETVEVYIQYIDPNGVNVNIGSDLWDSGDLMNSAPTIKDTDFDHLISNTTPIQAGTWLT